MSRSLRTRSRASAGSEARRTTSARIANAAGALRLRTSTETYDASQSAPVPSDAPRRPSSSASCTPSRPPAPSSSRSAVSEARPATSAVSWSAPLLTSARAEASGAAWFSAMRISRPLASVFRVTCGKWYGRGGPGLGAVVRSVMAFVGEFRISNFEFRMRNGGRVNSQFKIRNSFSLRQKVNRHALVRSEVQRRRPRNRFRRGVLVRFQPAHGGRGVAEVRVHHDEDVGARDVVFEMVRELDLGSSLRADKYHRGHDAAGHPL